MQGFSEPVILHSFEDATGNNHDPAWDSSSAEECQW